MTENLTVTEVADLLKIHPNTVRMWDKNGKLKATRTSGGQRRYELSEVKKFMRDDVWMSLVQSLWHTISMKQVVKKYLEIKRPHAFFSLHWLPVRNELFMAINRTYKLSLELKDFLHLTAEESQAFDNLQTATQPVREFCDRVLINASQVVMKMRGEELSLVLPWENVDGAINALRSFCEAIEKDHSKALDIGCYYEGVSGIDTAFDSAYYMMADGVRYRELLHEVAICDGPMLVKCNWMKRELTVEKAERA